MNFRVRLATADDDEFVSSLAAEVGLTVEPSAERERPQARLLVATTSTEERLGFVVGWCIADELELLDVAVRPSARRKGIAQSLVNGLLTLAQETGARTAFLEVRASNEAAQALYRGLGFEEVGRRRKYYPGGEDALLFRCCLPRGE